MAERDNPSGIARGPRFPNIEQRVAVIGRTGSGKTVFGAWLLSRAPFHIQPYVIFDFKGERMFRDLDRIKEIGLHEKVPKSPGLYIVRPDILNPETPDKVEEFLRKVHQKERTGLFIDEGYMMPQGLAFRALLTQGRSKKVPVITLVQRPAWVSRFVFSEADFYSVFHLNDDDDIKTVRRFAPKTVNKILLDHHSTWYDAPRDAAWTFAPSPPPEDIEDEIDRRLTPRRRLL